MGQAEKVSASGRDRLDAIETGALNGRHDIEVSQGRERREGTGKRLVGLSCLASIALCGALLVADAVDEIGFYFTGVFLVISVGGYCLMLAAPRSGFGWHRLAWPFIGLVPLFGWFALHELFFVMSCFSLFSSIFAMNMRRRACYRH
ncbi:hypothetical protein [Allorhizobium undicola]|uniref:hypothetical protein n=1 Tax=Allorhizobium undicola TaxID=78527 RepID=UPI003D340AEF